MERKSHPFVGPPEPPQRSPGSQEALPRATDLAAATHRNSKPRHPGAHRPAKGLPHFRQRFEVAELAEIQGVPA